MIASNLDNYLNWFPQKNYNWLSNWMGNGWHTESAYPLTSEKLGLKWADSQTVVGVRFQSRTVYALIDIDSTSPYHPVYSVDSVYNIENALETIGINRIIWIQSSSSGGIHGYFPFPESVPTFKTAKLLEQTLQSAGFTIKQGILEIFPNPKAYSKLHPTNYNGHRLPLQPGTDSWLLIHNESGGFDKGSDDINQWHLLMLEAAKTHDFELFKTKLKELKISYSNCTQHYSSSAIKWRQDLEALVQKGWTGSGQTNEILFNLLQLGVVFNSLEGQKLADWMIRIAQSMPNYERFCGHQHEINERCSDWVKWNETHERYKPYASQPDRQTPVNPPISPNNSRHIEAREKIARVVQELAGQIFNSCRQLLTAIIDKSKQIFNGTGISYATLYRLRYLWNDLLLPESGDKTLALFPPSTEATQLTPTESVSVTPSGCGFGSSEQTPKIAESSSTSTVTGNLLYEGFCTGAKNSSFRGGLQGGDKQRLMDLWERVKNRHLATAPQISGADQHPPKNSDRCPPENFPQSSPPPPE